MEFENICLSQDGPIATIVLNRPEKRNALSLGTMLELIECLETIGRSREARAVILRAAGKAFCSGHDLAEMTGRDIAACVDVKFGILGPGKEGAEEQESRPSESHALPAGTLDASDKLLQNKEIPVSFM